MTAAAPVPRPRFAKAIVRQPLVVVHQNLLELRVRGGFSAKDVGRVVEKLRQAVVAGAVALRLALPPESGAEAWLREPLATLETPASPTPGPEG